MSEWRLSQGELTAWLASLVGAGKRVVAPVEDGTLRIFQPIDSAEQACLASGKTRWSPKEHLFPRTEPLFSYSVRSSGVTLTPATVDEREQVIVGVRPCDAAGLARLDQVFMGGERDSLYATRRGRTAIVAFACDEAEPECFCTAVGGSPAGEHGSDVMLARAGDAWIGRTLTPKGEALTASLAGSPAPSAAERAQAEARLRQVAESMQRKPIAAEWAAALEQNFATPLWDALGKSCLGCSICSYVCPSCSCFDVTDQGNAWCGERCRSWDSCTFGLFTRHASGHNPRTAQPARYRQRVLHKFAYYPAQHEGAFMCVGCGRCVAMCPVGMNIEESVHQVVAASREGSDARG
jgi:ferredoxin